MHWDPYKYFEFLFTTTVLLWWFIRIVCGSLRWWYTFTAQVALILPLLHKMYDVRTSCCICMYIYAHNIWNHVCTHQLFMWHAVHCRWVYVSVFKVFTLYRWPSCYPWQAHKERSQSSHGDSHRCCCTYASGKYICMSMSVLIIATLCGETDYILFLAAWWIPSLCPIYHCSNIASS